MKRKHFFIYFGLVVVISSSLIIYSCQKEKIRNDRPENKAEQSLKDAQIEKRIIAFRDKIELISKNLTLKSGSEPMEIDSAIWYIEATANFTYGDASTKLKEYVVDSSFIEVPLTNGAILWVDVQAAYNQVIDSLSVRYASITANEKQLIVADISLKETTDNTANFEVISDFGTDGTPGFGNNYPWYWGGELGRCDGSGLGVGLDAADIIAQLANSTISVPSGNSYYTDVETIDVNPCDFTINGQCVPFYDFQEYTYIPKCLSPTDITFFENSIIYIGNQLMPARKSIISFHIHDDTAFALCGFDEHDCWYMGHFATIKYAVWHTSTNPPNGL